MFKLLFKSAVRSIARDRYQSLLNMVGLTLGVITLLYAVTYLFQEYSFDTMHAKSERIYRVVTYAKLGETEHYLPNSELPIAGTAKAELAEVEDATRIYFEKNVPVRVDDKEYIEERFWYADANFLEVFDFSLVEGDKSQVLAKPNAVVITPEFSRKYFGNENPVGRTIALHTPENLFEVTGIIEKVPSNSHLQFDMLASFSSLPHSERSDIHSWGGFQDMFTFLLLNENVNLQRFEAKFREFPVPYYKEMTELSGLRFEDITVRHSLQALEDIHLDPTWVEEVCVYGNKQLLHATLIIGVFIILIACFNFINLSTARSVLHAKEIGVKKVLGSNQQKIISQVLLETFLVGITAVIVSIISLYFLLPLLNQLLNLDIQYAQFLSGYPLLILISTPALIALLAGFYPSLVIARFNPLKVLHGNTASWNSNSGLRNGIVSFQFIVFIVLICATLIVRQQIQLLHKQNPGFHKENVLVVRNVDKLGNQRQAFKEALVSNTQVLSASFTTALPAMFDGWTNPYSNTDKEEQFFFCNIFSDADFISSMGIKLLDGRDFGSNLIEEQNNAILSRRAAELLGWSDCDNNVVFDYNNGGKYFNVIGIVEDFHVYSLRNKADPVIIRCADYGAYLALRIEPASAQKVLAAARQEWERFYNHADFDYVFLDETFDKQYRTEERLQRMVSVFSIISILIACLGLLGLVSFTLNRKVKEIGVRKVNGATIMEILIMLNQSFVKWIAISFIIACPLIWYFMNKWLEGFAYKIQLSWWLFALSGVFALCFALITVSWQSWRVASRNPVEALRYE